MNFTILSGRFTRDPDLRYTSNGNAVVSFKLAIPRKYINEEGEREADFINCVAWRKTAEFIAQYFTKGQMIAIQGRIEGRSYEAADGNKHYITEVVVEQAEFAGEKKQKQSPPTENMKEITDEITAEDLPF